MEKKDYSLNRCFSNSPSMVAILWDGKDPHISGGPEASSLLELYRAVSARTTWDRWCYVLRMEHSFDINNPDDTSKHEDILVCLDGCGGIATKDDCYVGYDFHNSEFFIMTEEVMHERYMLLPYIDTAN